MLSFSMVATRLNVTEAIDRMRRVVAERSYDDTRRGSDVTRLTTVGVVFDGWR